MNYIKLGGAIALFAGLLWLAKTVNDWHARSEELNQVSKAFADYRTEAARQAAEGEREERIDREITTNHLAIIQKQDADLAAARTELRGVRLRLAATDVPAGCDAGSASAGADDLRADKQPSVVAPADRGLDAEEIAERFAACDAVGARLNALIEWNERQAQSP